MLKALTEYRRWRRCSSVLRVESGLWNIRKEFNQTYATLYRDYCSYYDDAKTIDEFDDKDEEHQLVEPIVRSC